MPLINKVKQHLKNNRGSFTEQGITLVIAFVLGAILVALLVSSFATDGIIASWIKTAIPNTLNGETIISNDNNGLTYTDNTITGTPTNGAKVTYGDYTYTFFNDSWRVKPISSTKARYGDICASINEYPVTDMTSAFEGCSNMIEPPNIPDSINNMTAAFRACTSLTTPPAIPNSVTNMNGTFQTCVSLTSAPAIPTNVTNMNNTFSNCAKLTTAPKIPASVTDMGYTFANCTSLEGSITIDANPSTYNDCFKNTVKQMILIGSSTVRNEIAGTANNNNVHAVG